MSGEHVVSGATAEKIVFMAFFFESATVLINGVLFRVYHCFIRLMGLMNGMNRS